MEEIELIKELPKASEAKFPLLIDKNFDLYFQKFIHSYREKEHPTINLNNLLFLTGPEKCGKSWFLRKNLKKLEDKDSQVKNLIIHYDPREIKNSNFSSFLINFERSIIESLIRRNFLEIQNEGKEIISQKDLLFLLFYRWEKNGIEINLSKSLKRSIAENDNPYTYFINKGKNYNEILNLIESYEKKAFKEEIIIPEFSRIVEIIEEDMEISNLEASILLIMDCLIQKEDLRKLKNKKNEEIFINELYRDGLEVMEYLFDVLNFIAGYHEVHNKRNYLANKDKEDFYKANDYNNDDDDITDKDNNDKEKKDIYPHVVLAIESVHDLLEMKDCERRSKDYLHRIMLRLYVSII